MHKLDIANAKGTNGRGFNVRCECMSEANGSGRFWNYDTLNTEPVWSLAEAIEVYNDHLQTGARIVFPRQRTGGVSASW